jgi:hypothetical protein
MINDYLGMMFDFSFHDEVRINMIQYISKMIATFPKEKGGKVVALAADHLFKIREDGCKLNEKQADAFHHMIHQLLFDANWMRRDIQMAVSFLTIGVQEPDKDDWGKLIQILKYQNGTQYLKLILSLDQFKFTVNWYVDRSHQINKTVEVKLLVSLHLRRVQLKAHPTK